MTADRLLHLDDDALGREIETLDIAWPEPSSDVFDAALDALASERGAGRRTRRATVVLLVAAAMLALVAAAAAARLVFHVGAVSLRPAPGPTRPLPTSPVDPSVLGEAVSMQEAEAALGTSIPFPAGLGAPDRAWLDEGTVAFEGDRTGPIASLAWRPRAGLPRMRGTPFGATTIVFEGDETVAVKLIGTRWRHLAAYDVYVITAPHELDLLVDGRIHPFRVTGTVLIWQRGILTHRFETALPPSAAIRLAFG